MDFNKIPKPLFVVAVLLVGIFLFPFIQKPHHVCDSQHEIFKDSQKGYLYPLPAKNGTRAPIYGKLIENCKLSNSAGGCFEYFSMLRRIVVDLQNMTNECGASLTEDNNIKIALTESLTLMTQIAWGDKPPEMGILHKSWLDTSEIALFCQLKEQFLKLFGDENFESLKNSIYSKLPGEGKKIEENSLGKKICVNCENLRTADQTMPKEKIFVSSLFSVRCDQFR